MPQVRTPSGLLLDLVRPQLRRLLCYGALGARELADACMDRASVRARQLDEGDALFVASWCIDHLEGDEVVSMASVCERYGQAPSARMGVADRILAYEIDCQMGNECERFRERGASEPTGSGIAPDDPNFGFPKEDA